MEFFSAIWSVQNAKLAFLPTFERFASAPDRGIWPMECRKVGKTEQYAYLKLSTFPDPAQKTWNALPRIHCLLFTKSYFAYVALYF